MDVTEEVLRNHIAYGSSDYTASHSLSSSKSLNYASGASIQKPEKTEVRFIPFTLNYRDSVGLFGSENHFVKVNIDIDPSVVGACYEEEFWECAMLSDESGTVNDYEPAAVLYDEDLETVNTYEPALFDLSLVTVFDGYVSVDLQNLKTGNKFIDSWFDVRLYTSAREEHPYDKMYVRANDFFYIGFHARNTKRLPYNVDCIIGEEYLSADKLTAEQRKCIARTVQ